MRGRQIKLPPRIVALKLMVVAVPAAIIADLGIHRAATIGGLWGCLAGVSITALWAFIMVLMLKFFPPVHADSATTRLRQWALGVGFLLAECWAVLRSYEYYTSFSGPGSVAGAIALLGIWGTAVWYWLGLTAWAAAIRRR